MDVCERVNSSERRLFVEQIATVVALGCGRKVYAMWHVPHAKSMTIQIINKIIFYYFK